MYILNTKKTDWWKQQQQEDSVPKDNAVFYAQLELKGDRKIFIIRRNETKKNNSFSGFSELKVEVRTFTCQIKISIIAL